VQVAAREVARRGPAHWREENIMKSSESTALEGRDDPPGIVIHGTFGPAPRPSISAFIWGGKVRPVPTLPYGRRPAA
jgi:hypothetical protein